MKYIKKPVEIEAVQWTGENAEEILNFTENRVKVSGRSVEIPTLEGKMTASVGDYIIRGIHRELYPCKPDIFDATYTKCPE